MNILAVDTTTDSCSVFLRLHGKETHYHRSGQKAHADLFFQWIKEISDSNPNLFQSLDALGVCIGPGRFNGLRVGLSFISSAMLLYNLPAYVCTSHQLLAQESKDQGVQGYAVFAKYGHAYWCDKKEWWSPSLQKFDDLPVDICSYQMPLVPAKEHYTSLDIKNIIPLVESNETIKHDSYLTLEPLYVSHMI